MDAVESEPQEIIPRPNKPLVAFFGIFAGVWLASCTYAFLQPEEYAQLSGMPTTLTVPMVAFLWLSRSLYLGAIPMLFCLAKGAQSQTLESPTYGQVAFHLSTFNFALLVPYFIAFCDGVIAFNTVSGVMSFLTVWWVVAIPTFGHNLGAIFQEEIRATKQLLTWKVPLATSMMYGISAVACYVSAAIVLLTPSAPAFQGTFTGLTDLFRRHFGAGILLLAGCSSMLKTAAERGRLHGTVFRSLNWTIVVTGAMMVASLLWAQRHGMAIRAWVFWPVTVLACVDAIMCFFLANIKESVEAPESPR